MSRLSDRISNALSVQRCPGCGHFVTPVEGGESPGEDGAPADGKRWSFVWRPPRGHFCPDCNFPLSRYEGRIVWIRTFLASIALLSVTLLLWIGSLLNGGSELLVQVRTVTLIAGVITFVVGVAGLVFGGKHAAP